MNTQMPYITCPEGSEGSGIRSPHGNEVVVTLDVVVCCDRDLLPSSQLDGLVWVFEEPCPYLWPLHGHQSACTRIQSA